MIRQPSRFRQIYGWYLAALSGLAPATHDGLPEAGWFKMKLVQGGPWVPVRIWLDQVIDPETGDLADDEILFCEVSGEAVPRSRMEEVWTYLIPIQSADFEALTGRVMSDPTKKINLMMEAIGPNG